MKRLGIPIDAYQLTSIQAIDGVPSEAVPSLGRLNLFSSKLVPIVSLGVSFMGSCEEVPSI